MIEAVFEEIEEPSLPFDLYSAVSNAKFHELKERYFSDASFNDTFPKEVTGLSLHKFDARPAEQDWNDANHYLYVWVNDVPSAYVGWIYTDSLEKNKKSLWITTIQGVRHISEPKPVPPNNWQRQLVRCVEDIVHDSCFDTICITPAEQNMWFAAKTIYSIQIKQKKMIRAYNETASELGYTLRPVNHVLVRPCHEFVTRRPVYTSEIYSKILSKN